MRKIPIDPAFAKNSLRVKVRNHEFFAFFSPTVSFIIKIGWTKIVDHAILPEQNLCLHCFS